MPVIKSKNWPLAPRDREWDADAAEDRIRRWAGGPDKENIDWSKYRSCFLWYDDENPEAFTSYKLPKVYAEAAKQYKRFDEEPPPLRRDAENGIERRTVPFMEVRVDIPEGGPPVIRGYAAVFNSMSEPLGGYREVIRRGAFKRSIESGDIRALWNHNSDYVLGRTKNSTLKLREDIHGLAVEIEPPNTQFANDFRELISKGYVDQMSFGFRVLKENWTTVEGQAVRELLDVELFEVSPVAFPAYPQTTVAVRSVLQEAGIDWEALSSALIRSQRGLELTSADRDEIQSSIRALEAYLPNSGTQARAAGCEAEQTQARLALFKRRLEIAEAECDATRDVRRKNQLMEW